MMQKIVLEVQMNCEKCITKAKEIAAGAKGVESMAIDSENHRIILTGDRIDSICLTILLRKKLGHAKIVSIEEVTPEEQKCKKPDAEEVTPEEQKCKKPDAEEECSSRWIPYFPVYPPCIKFEVVEDPNPSCSLM